MSWRWAVPVSVGLVWLGGCAPPGGDDTGSHRAPAVYGTDDRAEYYESPSELHRRLTREAIVALVAASDVDATDPDDVQLIASDLQSAYGVCSSAPYATQPTAAFCSGTLIDDDLVLTAGHCFSTRDPAADCEQTRFVFDYHYVAADTLETIQLAQDVYACSEIFVQRNETLPNGEAYDHAVVRLDRPVTAAHAPAPVARVLAPLADGQPATMIGFPSGIPAKIDAGGRVADPRASTLDYFVSSNDVFAGNSGSGVFDDAGVVVGILAAGDADWKVERGCRVPYELPESSAGSWSSYAARAIVELCATGYPSDRLCGAASDAGTVPAPDAGTPDAGTPDAGTPDAGTPDAGSPDAGSPDAGALAPADAGGSDAGPGASADAGGVGSDGGAPLSRRDGGRDPLDAAAVADASSPSDASASVDAEVDGEVRGEADAGAGGGTGGDGGCSCRATTGGDAPSGWLGCLFAAAIWRRRRARQPKKRTMQQSST